MDSDDSPYLRPCKQLPSPTNDRQISHASMGQHLALQTSSQGQVQQGSRESSLEPCKVQDNTEDEASESERDYGKGTSEHSFRGIAEEKMARLLKSKEKNWAVAAQKRGPLRLLDLPIDVLKIILKEVTHTNDLANCAKVNSAFHAIVTPIIYSRFDIVWPDTLSSAEPRAGVDALTYGLATLVMREDLFESVLYSNNASCGASCQSFACQHCGSISYFSRNANDITRPRTSRRGNYFSQFVRKFSLGNGPTDWVQEYLVTKESGKMLGTLVALSIARMPNLESFVWDMPTGLLRDIWIALSSLGDNRPSKLEKLWVRFHDNHVALRDAGLLSPPLAASAQTSQDASGNPITLPAAQQQPVMEPRQYGVKKIALFEHHVEKPNFSTLPPMRSLTVLDIDEAQYLTELSVLLGRSLNTLRELRLGIAHTLNIPPSLQQNPEAAPFFNGGVLSLLLSNIYEYAKVTGATHPGSSQLHSPVKESTKQATKNSNLDSGSAGPGLTLPSMIEPSPRILDDLSPSDAELNHLGTSASQVSLDTIDPALFGGNSLGAGNWEFSGPDPESENAKRTGTEKDTQQGYEPQMAQKSSTDAKFTPTCSTEKLKLEVLEMERLIKLNPSILSKSIDFTVLTSLTLVQCGDPSSLWDRLRSEFAPRISRDTLDSMQSTKASSHQARLRRRQSSELPATDIEYRLRLKRIHTDTVSPDLISFLKTTLAPNSLEWMFLQNTESYSSPVLLDAIYRGPLRRHRASLIKVMIDSCYGASSSRTRVSTALVWMLNRDVLTFITSGKMCKLRELAVALDYRDWHFFLQRLPNIPHLRSLYIPNMSDHPYGNSLNVRDFALGAIDVVALRPEVELCYLGIKNKCFEILERKHHKNKSTKGGQSSSTATNDETDSDSDTQDGDHDDDDDDDDDSDAGAPAGGPPASAPAAAAVSSPDVANAGVLDSDTGSVTSDDEEYNERAGGKRPPRLKLREILFYDDKISIFKARHGRL